MGIGGLELWDPQGRVPHFEQSAAMASLALVSLVSEVSHRLQWTAKTIPLWGREGECAPEAQQGCGDCAGVPHLVLSLDGPFLILNLKNV